MLDKISDFFDSRSISIIFLISIILILLSSFLFCPLFTLEITFCIFIVLSILIITLAIFINFIIATWIGMQLEFHINQDWLLYLLRIIGILGSILGPYFMIKEILNINWANWGIKSFYSSMEPNSNPFSYSNKSIIGDDILQKYTHVWKALFTNIGRVIFFFMKNMLAPWSWISTTIGIFKRF